MCMCFESSFESSDEVTQSQPQEEKRPVLSLGDDERRMREDGGMGVYSEKGRREEGKTTNKLEK